MNKTRKLLLLSSPTAEYGVYQAVTHRMSAALPLYFTPFRFCQYSLICGLVNQSFHIVTLDCLVKGVISYRVLLPRSLIFTVSHSISVLPPSTSSALDVQVTELCMWFGTTCSLCMPLVGSRCRAEHAHTQHSLRMRRELIPQLSTLASGMSLHIYNNNIVWPHYRSYSIFQQKSNLL